MKNIIPIFFATDDRYIPYLGVTLESMIANASKDYQYEIYVLSTGLKQENMDKISKYSKDCFNISFVDLTDRIADVKEKFSLRDYYSMATYYRFFIADMFPQYKKALYLDCDTVIVGDISELYNIEIGNCYVGAIQDESLYTFEPFSIYVEKCLGIKRERYFNAGILIMNLTQFRKQQILNKFINLMLKYTFRVAQDQDYLNVICKGKVHYVDLGWNKGAIASPNFDESKLKLIHYNLNRKPWQNRGVKYEEQFWEYAKKTEFYPEIQAALDSFTDEMRRVNDEGLKNLVAMCMTEAEDPNNYHNKFVAPLEPVKAADRIEILKKIKQYEIEKRWREDVEKDPESIPLKPNQFDFYHKKITSKTKTYIINKIGRKYINMMIKRKQLIIKEVLGLENFIAIKDKPVVITCNHFNKFDNFAVYKALEKNLKHKIMYKVIREGNYTTMKGLFGLFFRNCNTLPIPSSKTCMKSFLDSIRYHLSRNEKILIYPEQGMWWNYRKPRPLQIGAFKFSAQNKCPLLPIFITMEDSDVVGNDGFPIQAYTVHILPAIYPDPDKISKENAEILRTKNYEMWKEVYEKVYGIPLTYITEK